MARTSNVRLMLKIANVSAVPSLPAPTIVDVLAQPAHMSLALRTTLTN